MDGSAAPYQIRS